MLWRMCAPKWGTSSSQQLLTQLMVDIAIDRSCGRLCHQVSESGLDFNAPHFPMFGSVLTTKKARRYYATGSHSKGQFLAVSEVQQEKVSLKVRPDCVR
mmetsp:Transcript_4187/g.6764  ORF Transcript_4187/g.6764 Transcript_4187/m.6764 type:complete len:99 (-) Transcript_4187:108-404(-)